MMLLQSFSRRAFACVNCFARRAVTATVSNHKLIRRTIEVLSGAAVFANR